MNDEDAPVPGVGQPPRLSRRAPRPPRPLTGHPGLALLLAALLPLAGCSKGGAPAKAEKTADPAEAAIPSAKPELAAVDTSIKSGAYDDAAAQLLQLVNSGRQFSRADAAEYRRALNDAYAKAVEAAEKGDKRAQDALKMLRAAGPR